MIHTKKNGFTERSKILTKYRKIILSNYQNNYYNIIRTLKLIASISKFFAALLIIFKVPTKLF